MAKTKTKRSGGRRRDPEAAQNKYSCRLWIRTTPETLAFLHAVKRNTGAQNMQVIINDAFRSYHRDWRKKDPNRIPPLTRRNRSDGT